MYTDNPAFIQPQNENQQVWRYMDFTKFVSLLDTSQLYFTRADKFEDHFEGSYPQKNVEARAQLVDLLNITAANRDAFQQSMARAGEINQCWPRYMALNCWHLSDHESAAMWRLYLKSNEGIVIQSTYQKFRICFSKVEEPVYIGQVNYIDYGGDTIPGGNFFLPFTCKRRSFEHEKEVRAMLHRPPITNSRLDFSVETIQHGVQVAVDLKLLIENVYVAPDAPEWVVRLVRSVIAKYGHSFEVNPSQLNQRPLY